MKRKSIINLTPSATAARVLRIPDSPSPRDTETMRVARPQLDPRRQPVTASPVSRPWPPPRRRLPACGLRPSSQANGRRSLRCGPRSGVRSCSRAAPHPSPRSDRLCAHVVLLHADLLPHEVELKDLAQPLRWMESGSLSAGCSGPAPPSASSPLRSRCSLGTSTPCSPQASQLCPRHGWWLLAFF